VLLYEAGLIKMKSGDPNRGIALMNEALQLNPFISPALKREGQNYLAAN
jgi:hypothetical protein